MCSFKAFILAIDVFKVKKHIFKYSLAWSEPDIGKISAGKENFSLKSFSC